MYLNVATIFLLSGFWHGANWTFIAWGAIHAVLIIMYIFLSSRLKFKKKSRNYFSFVSIIFTNILVAIAWIFFRANSIGDAVLICKRIFNRFNSVSFQIVLKDINGAIKFSQSGLLISITMIAIMFLIERLLPANLYTLNKKPIFDVLFMTITIIFIIFLGVFYSNSFIYFQF
jgi:D-alanyl-lipoteichoic acid acyltransferase DltB (MBOAT superfamily)